MFLLVTVASATISAATITTISAASATTAPTISATATAAFTGFHRARFIDGQGAAVDFLAVEFRDGRLGLFRRTHFHETKTAGTSRHAIVDHLHPRNIARLGKEIGQVIFRHAEGQIAHVEFNAHYFLLGWLADVSGIGSTLPLS
jgi:hypothetical protein